MADQRPGGIASRVRAAREARSLSQRQVADATKLSVRAIDAVEKGRMDLLPSGIYRRSIVRAVAEESGLNPVDALKAFVSEYPDDLPPPPSANLVASESPSTAGRHWRRLFAVLGAIVPMVAGGVYFARNARTATPVVSSAPAQPGAWQKEIVPVGGFGRVLPEAVHPLVVAITVSARCELRVIADGRVMVDRTVNAGEWLHVDVSERLDMSGDNAAAVQFSINGQAGRMLGVDGEPLAVHIGRDDYRALLVGR